jgi:ABC-type transport system involved in multi-copper enzyme maturation permease subunit
MNMQHATRDARHASRFTSFVSRLINPIIIKEMRGNMRGPRAFLILTGYLVGLSGLAYGLYRMTLTSLTSSGMGSSPQSAYVGQMMFVGLAFLELLFVCFITPTLTAGAISGESERRTYDVLLATPLRPASILWGKMVASLSWVLLLILAAIPLSSVIFLFGGLALRDVIQVIGLLGLVAITYGTLGMFFSALTRRTGRATALTYLVVLVLVFGGMFVWTLGNSMGGRALPRGLLYSNPISALASAVITPEMNMYGGGPATSLLFLVGGGPDSLGFYSSVRLRPVWQYTAALYLALTALLYLATAQLVKPVRRWRIGWKGLIAWLLVLAVLAGGLWVVFGTQWGTTGFGGSLAPMPTPPPMPMPAIAPGVAVVQVASPMPMPTPAPPPTLMPASSPFDAGEHTEAMQDLLVQQLFSGGSTAFCDLLILGDDFTSDATYVNVWAWGRCRAFSVEDGELSPGALISGPFHFDLNWSPDLGWQLTGGGFVSDLMNPMLPFFDFQQRLLENPYDEAAGEARLEERAREALLGE